MDTVRHSTAYRIRRVANWVPLGLTYALFYMGRYNLTVAKSALGDELMTKAEFGKIFGLGAIVYGLSFLFTGPLTDRIGGRRSMLVGTAGTIMANFLMGLVLYGITNWGWGLEVFSTFAILYAINMHFQSYGAIALVTTKAPWFHVKERGKFSTIFGWMIALGVFFAFDWGYAITAATRSNLGDNLGLWAGMFQWLGGTGGTGVDQNWWLFWWPSIFLTVTGLAMAIWLRNTPREAGYPNFYTGEESVSEDGGRLPAKEAFKRILRHPVLRIVIIVEFCSGILRNGVMHWYPLFAGEVGFKKTFWISHNWGLSLLICGVLGAVLTGWASDRFFQSRRGPMAAIMYALMFVATGAMIAKIDSLWVMGIAVLTVSMAVIGVHGIMSGTSTADFGGAKNAGVAVGVVDGFVYLGTGLQFLVIGHIAPEGAAAKIPGNWENWPIFLLPFAGFGLVWAALIWNALPRRHE